MGNLINRDIAGNWENWLRVFLMVAIGGAMVHFVRRYTSNKKG